MLVRILASVAIIFNFTMMVYAQEKTFQITGEKGRNLAQFESDAPIETVIGKTDKISGTLTLDPSDISKGMHGYVSVDLVSLDTGIGMRDRDMRNEPFLYTEKYPEATFIPKEVIRTESQSLKYGKPVNITLRGDFQVRGVTRTIEVIVEVTYLTNNNSEVIHANSSFQILLGDYGIKRPKFLFLQLAEEVDIKISFTAPIKDTITEKNDRLRKN